MSLHRCSEAECPYLGEPSSRHCRCHRTDEEVLRAENKAMREALESLEGRVEEASDWLHNSQGWRDRESWIGGMTIWEWIFAPARAALKSPDHSGKETEDAK